jgi:hypothetical protein
MNHIFTTVFLLLSLNVGAQEDPFSINLEPLIIEDLGGIQSYAFGKADGRWLIVGGRLDGLHRRQPWASFDIAGHNDLLWVIDPETRQKWTADLSSLPSSLKEQLSSTNMQFIQEGNMLYCIGGYGYSPSIEDHTTYNTLTAIRVDEVIDAIIEGRPIGDYFRQISDDLFQVTGGQLLKMNDQYYLLGGQKFLGRYNPMGPDHGPGFIQEYTNSIHIFSIEDDGKTLNVDHLDTYSDLDHLHRRDYNAEAQIMPNGSEGITMFSGVFQLSVDLPYLNSVDVTSEGYQVNEEFLQYYNHYHCPVIPIYSEEENEMHNVFFGGIAQYYDDQGTLVQDNNVPFVNTIARVTRDGEGHMSEYKLPEEMPALLGAGGEFIHAEGIPEYENGVIRLDDLQDDKVMVGYLFGGISSSAPNIFFINNGDESQASSMVYKVWLTKETSTTADVVNEASFSPLKPIIYPDPNNGRLRISYSLLEQDEVRIKVTDLQGRNLISYLASSQEVGRNVTNVDMSHLSYGNTYLITIHTSQGKFTQRLVLE